MSHLIHVVSFVIFLCLCNGLAVGQDLLPTLRKAEKATTDKDYDLAKSIYYQMIANPRSKMDTTMAYAYANMAHFFFAGSNRDSVLYYYEAGYEYYKKHNNPYRQRYFLNAISSSHKIWKNYELSRAYTEKSIKVRGPVDIEYITAHNQIASYLRREGNLDSAEIILLRNLELLDSLSLPSSLTWLNLAGIEKKRGNFPKAISHYTKTIETYQNEYSLDKSPLFVSNNYVSMSRLFLQLKNYEKAHEMLDEAKKIVDENDFKSARHRQLRERGVVFIATNLDSAIHYLNLFNEGLSDKSKDIDIHSANVFLAQAYLGKDQMDKARYHLDIAKRIFSHIKEDDQKFLFYKASGLYRLKSNQMDKAIAHFDKAMAIAQKLENESNQIQMIGLLEKAYAKKGNVKKAYALKEEYQKRHDDLTNLQSQQIIYELEGKFQKSQQDLEISKLTISNKDKDLDIASKNRLLWMGLFGLLGISLLGWQSFRLYTNKKKSNLLLEEKNAIISKSLSEKELLLKEIHHRVKNNLQVVSSLLSLQSDYIKDDSALNAINEGRNRVKSMALIHQNLYQEENLTGIKVKEYFSKLVAGLFHSYNISSDKVKLELDIEDIVVDVDTIVPLGLISNELISNALKYAFPNNNTGIIKVNLHQTSDQLILVVEDNGVGFDTSQINEDISSFGYQMVQSFCDKLNADLDISSSGGTSIKITVNRNR